MHHARWIFGACLVSSALVACAVDPTIGTGAIPVESDPSTGAVTLSGAGGAGTTVSAAAAMTGTTTGAGGGASASTGAGGAGTGQAANAIPAFSVCSPAQSAAIGLALNQGEVEQAQAVLSRLTTPEAKAFAQRMITDHTAAVSTLEQLVNQANLVPEESGISKALEEQTQLAIQSLQNKSGKDLDAAYIDQQILGHEQALAVIDSLALPAVTNTATRTAIQDDRAMVVMHLGLAIAAQTAIEGACGGELGPAPCPPTQTGAGGSGATGTTTTTTSTGAGGTSGI